MKQNPVFEQKVCEELEFPEVYRILIESKVEACRDKEDIGRVGRIEYAMFIQPSSSINSMLFISCIAKSPVELKCLFAIFMCNSMDRWDGGRTI